MKILRSITSFFLFSCLIFITLVSCEKSSRENEEESFSAWVKNKNKIKVLTTIGILADVVKVVGGEHISALTLVKGGLNPHAYELVKGDGEKLNYADIIFYNGLGLEHSPSLRYSLENSGKAVPLGNRIMKKYPDRLLVVQGAMDPHIWMDVAIWKYTVPIIVEELIRVDPKHEGEYKANGDAFIAELERTHEEIYELLQSIPEKKRFLITSHDAFNYFARSYLAAPRERSMEQWKKRFQAPEGLAPEAQISTTDIQFIIDHMLKYDVCVLFPESNVSQNSISKILDAGNEKGMNFVIAKEFLYGDTIGKKGTSGDSYIKMMKHNANTIKYFLENDNGQTEQ